jgi:CDP-4-dehydro-6-deoxyglucose reductase, E1
MTSTMNANNTGNDDTAVARDINPASKAVHNVDQQPSSRPAKVPAVVSGRSSAVWRDAIIGEWQARRAADPPSDTLFPLAANPFGEDEIVAMADVLLTGRLTMGDQVNAAEKAFAQAVGSPYAVMVNSGSSANLLAVAAMVNKLRKGGRYLQPGDQVLVPAVCWSTSVFPLIQLGLEPVFVDVDPVTFNATVAEMEKRMNPGVKAVMAVHVLGNSTDMAELAAFVQKHNLVLIEDTCEALGTFYTASDAGQKQHMLGTCGDFGTYSFYFSHHITSGEGGMVVCKTEDDYNLLRCLRAHGWTRHLTNKEQVEAEHPLVDARFLFVNVGFNVRPMEVQAAMLNVQLPKLAEFNACRRSNLARFQYALNDDGRLHQFLALMKPTPGTDPAWFGISAVLHAPYAHQLRDFLAYLHAQGVENRPIISGNFVRQPCIEAFVHGVESADKFPGAEILHTRGFFIGVHQLYIDDGTLKRLIHIMAAFKFSAALA